MLPAHQSYKLAGDPQKLSVTKAEWDTTPDAVFDMPAEVSKEIHHVSAPGPTAH
jgi:hypothetical protein